MAQRKSDKKETRNNSQNKDEISVCDVMKNNTSKVIRKMESAVPASLQMHSDLYTRYLHLLDDAFGTCYIAEKQFFDRAKFDKKTLQGFDKYCGAFSQIVTDQIDLSGEFQKSYMQVQSAWLQAFDQYVHYATEYYARTLSRFNAPFGK